MIPKRLKDRLGKEKSKKELDEHYEGLELEKGDFFAMLIAAFITFFPVLIISMVLVYGLLWIFFMR
jgi:hypothetical protein